MFCWAIVTSNGLPYAMGPLSCLSVLSVCLSVCNVDRIVTKRLDGTTWYSDRPRPRRHCVRWGPSFPHIMVHSSPFPHFSARVYFGPCLLWPVTETVQVTLFRRTLVSFFPNPNALVAFNALTLLVGWQERHLACKKGEDGGGGHWLVRMEWRPAGWPVCLPLLIFPCTIKSRSSLLALAHPGGPKKGP